MPKRHEGYRLGNPPYAATAFTSAASSISKTTSKKVRPAAAAASSARTAACISLGGSEGPLTISDPAPGRP